MAEPGLTPELVSLAISNGMLDESLPALKEIIKSRIEVLDNKKRYSLKPGDKFIIKDCSPKKWNGQAVTFVRNDGMWLVVETDDPRGRMMRVRTGHVGTILGQV